MLHPESGVVAPDLISSFPANTGVASPEVSTSVHSLVLWSPSSLLDGILLPGLPPASRCDWSTEEHLISSSSNEFCSSVLSPSSSSKICGRAWLVKWWVLRASAK